jgi:hypothetical protein
MAAVFNQTSVLVVQIMHDDMFEIDDLFLQFLEFEKQLLFV